MYIARTFVLVLGAILLPLTFPVAAGASHPLVGPLRTAPAVHGVSGLEGAELPAPLSEPLTRTGVTPA